MRTIPFILLGAILINMGCTSVRSTKSRKYEADTSLIIPYSFALERERPFIAPYVATFFNQGKTLHYVAAAHVSVEEYPNLLTHPTFLTIEKLFADHPIDAIIIEGIAPWNGAFPKELFDHGDWCESTGYKTNCGEPWFAIQQARKRNVRIITGEPSESEILRAVRDNGFTAQDLLGFYVVRQIPEWRREGKFPRKPVRKLIDAQLRSDQKSLEVNVKFGFEEFNGWYKAHIKKPAYFMDLDVNDMAPLSTPDASYAQRIGRTVAIARNQAIVNHLAEALNERSNVLVVYGASHFLVQKAALETMLGKPVFEKLF